MTILVVIERNKESKEGEKTGACYRVCQCWGTGRCRVRTPKCLRFNLCPSYYFYEEIAKFFICLKVQSFLCA